MTDLQPTDDVLYQYDAITIISIRGVANNVYKILIDSISYPFGVVLVFSEVSVLILSSWEVEVQFLFLL
jgi:hypothetical protein